MLSPSAANGREDHTYAVACDADVTQLLRRVQFDVPVARLGRTRRRPEVAARSGFAEGQRAEMSAGSSCAPYLACRRTPPARRRRSNAWSAPSRSIRTLRPHGGRCGRPRAGPSPRPPDSVELRAPSRPADLQSGNRLRRERRLHGRLHAAFSADRCGADALQRCFIVFGSGIHVPRNLRAEAAEHEERALRTR